VSSYILNNDLDLKKGGLIRLDPNLVRLLPKMPPLGVDEIRRDELFKG
jgi:hypothetical protein